MKATHLGKVSGALGLVLLLSSPFTLFLTSGSLLAAGLKAGLGLALVGVYLATHVGQLGRFTTSARRTSSFAVTTALLVVGVVGALVALNLIAHKRGPTWDLTREGLHSLSPQTREALGRLGVPVRALGFLPAEHPARPAAQALLERYAREAPGRFEFSFKDPRKHPDLAQRYALREGQTTVVLTRGEGDDAPHTALHALSEQELTNALLKLEGASERKVYFVSGHGEWPLEGDEGAAVGELQRELAQEGLQAEALALAGKAEVPRDAALVVVAGARTPFSPPELSALGKYLEQGGRLAVFADAALEPKLDALLAEHGVKVEPGVVADAQVNSGSPYVPLSAFYAEHEVTRPLRRLGMHVEVPTARGLTLLSEGVKPGVKAQALLSTSPYAWVEATPDGQPAPSAGERQGSVPLVVASTRPTDKAEGKRFDEARLVVFGDAELLVDANWGHEANRNLVLNALAWATSQVQRVTIRPPARELSTVDLSPEALARLRFLSTDLLPLSLLGVGLAIWVTRRNR